MRYLGRSAECESVCKADVIADTDWVHLSGSVKQTNKMAYGKEKTVSVAGLREQL